MSLAFYMDHHVPRAITVGLRLRGVDVLTAYEAANRHPLSGYRLRPSTPGVNKNVC